MHLQCTMSSMRLNEISLFFQQYRRLTAILIQIAELDTICIHSLVESDVVDLCLFLDRVCRQPNTNLSILTRQSRVLPTRIYMYLYMRSKDNQADLLMRFSVAYKYILKIVSLFLIFSNFHFFGNKIHTFNTKHFYHEPLFLSITFTVIYFIYNCLLFTLIGWV